MYKKLMLIAVLVFACGLLAAAPKKPLPAWETAAEKAASKGTKVPFSLQLRVPPQDIPYGPPEYGAMAGVVIQIPTGWNQLNAYYGEMVKGIVAAKAKPYIIVANTSEKNSVLTDVLTPYGVAESDVEFYLYPYDANWTRDYGPWMVYTNGRTTRALVDHHYYDERKNDDAVPGKLGLAWDDEVFVSGFYTEGGNFMTDGLGTCWMSTGVYDKNSLEDNETNRATVAQLFKQYLGCDRVFHPVSIPGEGTTHIDMYSKILDQDTIIVSYSSAEWGADTDELAQLDTAAELYGSIDKPGGGKYTIVRIPMTYGGSGSFWDPRTYFTHTNSLIVNDHVLVPTYGRGTDEEALQIYRDLMPGYTIIGIDSNEIIPQGGSIHCTTMQIPPEQYQACGDGVIAGEEECEPLYLGGETCITKGYASGALACTDACLFDLSQCSQEPADDDIVPDYAPDTDDTANDDTVGDEVVNPDDTLTDTPVTADDIAPADDEEPADEDVAVIVPDSGKRAVTNDGCGCSVLF
ncbi:MAG TPA: agmatine deiminase family protein [bacterium]|nr:agmatine deiminase family protein [bacterium]